MKFCKDCECHRPDQARCNKCIPQGQIDCPEFEEKDKWIENKKQMVTTRNPYFSAQDLFSNLNKSANDAIDVMRYGWESIGNHYVNVRKEYNKMFKMDKVKKVIFNPPATIVYWFDGTKTIVKVQDGEIFDKEKGFAMACAKKFFGNEGNYYNEFRKHGADNHCYSVHIDLAHPGEVVKSSIGDGISYDGAGSVSMSPNKIRELVGLPPVKRGE